MRFRVCQALLVLCWVVIGTLAVNAQTPPQIEVENWQGGYGGVHAGYRWGDVDIAGGPFGTETFSLNAALIGSHIGYNVVLANNILIGVEADIDAAGKQSQTKSINQSFTIPQDDDVAIVVNNSQISTVSMGWQATLRARLGIVDGGTLYYTTAGVAWLDTDWTQTASIGGVQSIVSKSEVIPGWVVGGGVATFVDDNLIARGEYLYEEFFEQNVPLAGGGSGTFNARAHKLRFGVSIHF